MAHAEMFEWKKVAKNVFVDTLKQYFMLMVNKNVSIHNSLGESKKYGESERNLRKYLYLVSAMDKHEERLQLWFCMTED